jgi:hypothetical protein
VKYVQELIRYSCSVFETGALTQTVPAVNAVKRGGRVLTWQNASPTLGDYTRGFSVGLCMHIPLADWGWGVCTHSSVANSVSE